MTTGILSPVHIAFLIMVVLMLFGAKRLPEMGKSLGSGLRGFKESLEGSTEEKRPQLAAADQVATPAATTAARSPSQALQSVSERPRSNAAAQ
jgi:sec-independent protein translocase protein TatA